jgi:CrcB protein
MNIALLFIIGTGGFFGAISRFLIASYMQRSFDTLFPIGTLSVNVIGSFLIGIFAMLFENIVAPEYKALVMTGFLGALTTFSTFSLEGVMMLQEGAYGRFALNVISNVTLSILATILAILVFKKLYA